MRKVSRRASRRRKFVAGSPFCAPSRPFSRISAAENHDYNPLTFTPLNQRAVCINVYSTNVKRKWEMRKCKRLCTDVNIKIAFTDINDCKRE